MCAQKQVNSEEFGPTLADLEKQIAAHNIQHKEIEAYNSQLCVSSAGGKVTQTHSLSLGDQSARFSSCSQRLLLSLSQEEYTALKKQYNNLVVSWNFHTCLDFRRGTQSFHSINHGALFGLDYLKNSNQVHIRFYLIPRWQIIYILYLS